MAETLTLYGSLQSGHAFKVRLALSIAGLAHDYHEIDIDSPRESRPEGFRKAARFGEVPTLVADGNAMVQSDAILCWLAEETGRFGGETRQRLQRVREWLFWEANRIGMCLPQLRWGRAIEPGSIAPDALAFLQARYDLDVARLDRELSDGRGFIVDDEPTVADFSLCGYLVFADEAKVMVPAHVRGWLDRLKSLPGWRDPLEY